MQQAASGDAACCVSRCSVLHPELEVALRASAKTSLTAEAATRTTATAEVTATTLTAAALLTLVGVLLRTEDAQELLGCEEGGELGALLLLDIQTLL